GDQGGLAADPVAEMSEDRRTHRARDEADGIDAERLQRAHQRVGVREEQLGEHQAGDDAVEEEIVPLDRGADRAGDHRAAELGAMLSLREYRQAAHRRSQVYHRRPSACRSWPAVLAIRTPCLKESSSERFRVRGGGMTS